MIVLETNKYKINNIYKGIHEYIPVIYDKASYILANISFHSTLVGKFINNNEIKFIIRF